MTKTDKTVETPIKKYSDKLDMIRMARKDWEGDQYKKANEGLYDIIWSCFELVQNVYKIEDSDVQTSLIEELRDVVFNFVTDTNDVDMSTKGKQAKSMSVVQCVRDYVFVGAELSKHQKSDYKRVMDIARDKTDKYWTQNEEKSWDTFAETLGREPDADLSWKTVDKELFVSWIRQGIHNITRRKETVDNTDYVQLDTAIQTLMKGELHQTLGSVRPIICPTEGTMLEADKDSCKGDVVMIANFVTDEKFTLLPVALNHVGLVKSAKKKFNEKLKKTDTLAETIGYNQSHTNMIVDNKEGEKVTA
jgi:hypothetical protein